MKKTLIAIIVISVMLVSFSFAISAKPTRDMGEGWPHYVNIEVDWDGSSSDGDWNVYAQKYFVETHPGFEVGDKITGCENCLEMNYDFEFKGKTLQFDETYVSGVNAYPQTHHVVLQDKNRNGVYTGEITARYDFPNEDTYIRMDIIEYIVETEDGEVTNFHYVEKEYKKPLEV